MNENWETNVSFHIFAVIYFIIIVISRDSTKMHHACMHRWNGCTDWRWELGKNFYFYFKMYYLLLIFVWFDCDMFLPRTLCSTFQHSSEKISYNSIIFKSFSRYKNYIMVLGMLAGPHDRVYWDYI